MYNNFVDLDDVFPSPAKVEKNKLYTPLDFYGSVIPLSKSIRFKLGYFSSNAISTLASGFAQFIYNGGVIELMINQFVSESDYKLLNSDIDSHNGRVEFIESKYLMDLEELNEVLKECNSHFFNCLRYLINHTKQIKILPVTCVDGELSHYKEAIFEDIDGNKIYSNGSGNFTKAGILDNGESFIIHRSWKNDEDKQLIDHESNSFDKIFNREAINEFIYLSPDKLIITINSCGKDKELNELLEDEATLRHKLIKRKKISEKQKKFEGLLIARNIKIREEILANKRPSFPYPKPRAYQTQAHINWLKNDKKGVFAMATGTGKTLTSLNCLLKEYDEAGSYRAIILVPTIALVQQWKNECGAFNFDNVVKISSQDKWEKDVSYFNASFSFTNSSYIIISTYASFVKPKFQAYFKNLSKDTLFIADEAHNLGSPQISKMLPGIHLKKRIGLSATPNRIYDTDGNDSIDLFFNDKTPYVYSFSMKEAIAQGFLCNYLYYPHIVQLKDIEQEEYEKITKAIVFCMNSSDLKNNRTKSSQLERLLLERKRIIHKAENKKSVFQRIVREEFKKRGTLAYTLVYVPEGIEPNYTDMDVSNESDEELALINKYTAIVSSVDRSIMVKQYTSKSGSRDAILDDFKDGKTHVLTSMKCLDEGVDVPRSELAIFCASTGNPRQFIQRRGRVLRLAEGKDMAVIHDLVVIPHSQSKDQEVRSVDQNLVRNELSRVVNFAFLSENKMTTFIELEDICENYGLNLFEIHSNL